MLSEKKYLSEYDINLYDRPSVAADIALFTMRTTEEDSYRHEPENHLSLLLIRRGEHPYKSCWALPGGFLRKEESIEACAAREISQEAGVTPAALMAVDVFSEPQRDPRGWIISHSFLSIASMGAVEVTGGDDADDACWFDVWYTELDKNNVKLTLHSSDIEIIAILRKSKKCFGKAHYEIEDSGGLAFDHAAIIASALDALKGCAKEFELIFDFLPEKFTLTELQRVQETILNESVLTANFRRKVAPYVLETDECTSGAGHRPAKLFKRNTTEDLT